MNLQFATREVDCRVFIDSVSRTVQRDGQRLLDAMRSDDRTAISALRDKYERDAGLAQGGGGAGPGKMKTGRRGAATIHNLADAALRS